MRIGLYHGYELTGSGSNEYTRYLSRALARLGHEVHVLCREPHPGAVERVEGRTLHLLPQGDVRPVYLDDKQREGNVKPFTALTDAELDAYHDLNVRALREILASHPVDLLHANHLVYQPVAAADAGVPFIVYPHGSSIEYILRQDQRLKLRALSALRKARGIISGSREMMRRIGELFSGESFRSLIVGVGVDTSLFAPAGPEALDNLKGRAYAGKRPDQGAELRERLDRGELEAVEQYGDAYDHGQPDADLIEKVGLIPWGDGSVLLFVGALAAGKGLHNLIAALPALPDAHLVVVGSGAYREVLEALVHAIATQNQSIFGALCAQGFDLDKSDLSGGWPQLGGPVPHDPTLAQRVHFLGRLDHELLRFVFPCADVAVCPSVVAEAYPLVLMEALASGVLPAVSDFSGLRDGLDALEPLLGKQAVDRMRLPMEPAGIAARLRDLLEAEPVLGLHETAVQHFDWQVVARRMVEAYERLLV